MHGFRIDPATGWDYDPKYARLRRRLALAGPMIALLSSGGLFRAFPVVGIVIFCLLILYGCVVALTRGLQARALALRVGEDTRLARQLRFEQAIGLAIPGVLLGTGIAMGAWSVDGLGLALMTGLAAAVVLGSTLTGLVLAWRYRPDSVGGVEHPAALERR